MKKRLTVALLALVMVLGAIPNAAALLDGFSRTRTYHNQFSDVSTSSWYYSTVKTAYELGIFNGTSDTKFSPNKTLNADEMTALLARIHAAYYGNTITENANGSWAEKYYAYVTSHIDSGYRNSLNSKTAVTRLDFAYWMSKALPDKEYTAINTVPSGQIYDLEQSNTQRANRVYLFYRAGILSGNDKYGTFAPQSSITRVQVAAIISRMIDPSQRQRFTLKTRDANAMSSYFGDWNIGTYNRYWFNFKLWGESNQLYCTASVVTGQYASRYAYAENVPLTLNSSGTQATGYYRDNRGNAGTITLDFDNGNMYITITVDDYQAHMSAVLSVSRHQAIRGRIEVPQM